MQKYFFILTFLLVGSPIFSQKVYTSLKEAMKNPTKVEELDLGKEKIKKLPENIGDLVNLKVLRLEKNKLIGLPKSFSQLKKLEVLDLRKNKLGAIPEALEGMENLKILRLAQNPIDSIPTWFPSLISLENLDLWDTELKEFPEVFKEMQTLKILDIRQTYIWQKHVEETYQSWMPNTEILSTWDCDCNQSY